ncbi:(2E 6E)-farnesyl diphosphate synthase [Paramagnetospirillum magnetotacticum MS-1]|uniref:(2E 6E)-farnesyl diphosphate synthase n=1 Tax=Paramagnetospirillum magnetotacticum MS-1 TaxID=272627 RepID=A0A0C2YWB8_PARME|nr:farnesyl diphosphate synthase [Paramagnetospirillum magnetotacticum]KIL99418.1 (2E 6E)-farnesyl diphosphate synthase [Paramagnetospirillum magnetotacticum MS-1]
MSSRLTEALTVVSQAVNSELDRLLPVSESPDSRVHEAMRYSTLDGGKRLRPFLVMQSASLFNVAESAAIRVACAIEMIHCYSLVHDDLPCMDDDDLRRGRPTCHKAFDEATALLAGDALLTKAFEVLVNPATHADPAVRCELVADLAHASGGQGMVGGQMIDLQAHTLDLDVAGITRLQQLKTGRLFSFSCEAGAVLGKAHGELRLALRNYAHDLGLAFQIADDILDVEGDVAEVGKRLNKDADAGKATFVSLLGLERAKSQADMLAEQACRHLDPFGEKADLMRDVARFVVRRRS